jgi:hypothetical protein
MMDESGIIAPVIPPMVAWQRASEPGWPFHHPGGPLPGALTWIAGEQLAFAFGDHRPIVTPPRAAAGLERAA